MTTWATNSFPVGRWRAYRSTTEPESNPPPTGWYVIDVSPAEWDVIFTMGIRSWSPTAGEIYYVYSNENEPHPTDVDPD